MKHYFKRTFNAVLVAGLALSAGAFFPGCELAPIELDNIDSNTTLRAGTYIARKNISVRNGAKLTIMPGVKIIFEQGRRMSVEGPAKIHAVGTKDRPILITGERSTRGYWGGLRLYNSNSMDNRLEYVTIEYGGGYYDGNLYLTGSGSSPTRVAINNSTFRQGSKFGLRSNGTVMIEEFGENTLTANAEGAASLDVDHIGYLEDTSTFSGNDVDIIAVPSGNVNVDAVWRGLDAPLFIATNVSVTAALEIEPGAVLQFDSGRRMSVDSDGSLAAVGAPEALIVFTGAEFTPGYWGGLRFYNSNKTANRLSNVVFEYGGGYYDANVYLIGSSAVPSRVAIDGCYFENSSQYGLRTNGTVIITGFAENVLTENSQGAALVDANHVGFLDASSSFSGNVIDVVHVDSGNVNDHATWSAIDVPYYIDTNVTVNANLVVLAGAVLEFNAGRRMSVDSSGSLSAIGTADAYIFFTGTEPMPGYWGGLRFYNSNAPANNLSHVVFEYGGGYYNANLYLVSTSSNNARAVVQDCIFRHSSNWGIRLGGTYDVNPDIATANTFEANVSGAISGLL